MKTQEVFSIITEPDMGINEVANKQLITYPELESYFERGLYIEKVVQTAIQGRKLLITFVMRYYNMGHPRIED